MSVGSFWGNAALDWLMGRNTYVALHTSDPGVSGLPASEFSGGDYARDLIPHGGWNLAASRQINTSQIIEYNNVSDGIITHIGVWDSLTAGNIIASGAFTTPLNISDGDQVLILGGNMVVSL